MVHPSSLTARCRVGQLFIYIRYNTTPWVVMSDMEDYAVFWSCLNFNTFNTHSYLMF